MKKWLKKNLIWFVLFFLCLSITTGSATIYKYTQGLDDYSLGYKVGFADGYLDGQQKLNQSNMDYWRSLSNSSQDKFEIMRDLFTPGCINDTVTISDAGYI